MHRLETAVPFPHAHETDNITKHVARLCKARLVTLHPCANCDVHSCAARNLKNFSFIFVGCRFEPCEDGFCFMNESVGGRML
jgi:hypothetical protein